MIQPYLYRDRQVSVLVDEPTATYEAVSVLTGSEPATEPIGPVVEVRALVEVLRQGGGLAPRALVGGHFTSGSVDRLTIEVGMSGPLTVGESTTCTSQLWKPLVPGLPPEFAETVLAGLLRGVELPPGVLRIDSAGFDEV